MATWHVLLAIVTLVAVGFFQRRMELMRLSERFSLAAHFLECFLSWFNDNGKDHSKYNWLLENSEEVQITLGHGGIIDMKQPYANYIHRNYPVILNEIPTIAAQFSEGLYEFNSIANRELHERARLVDGCLRRYIGTAEKEKKRLRRRLSNPFVLLSAGVGSILGLPFWFLEEAGAITAARRAKIVTGSIFGTISGVIALLGFVSTLVTIITGWEGFVRILKGWFGAQ